MKWIHWRPSPDRMPLWCLLACLIPALVGFVVAVKADSQHASLFGALVSLGLYHVMKAGFIEQHRNSKRDNK